MSAVRNGQRSEAMHSQHQRQNAYLRFSAKSGIRVLRSLLHLDCRKQRAVRTRIVRRVALFHIDGHSLQSEHARRDGGRFPCQCMQVFMQKELLAEFVEAFYFQPALLRYLPLPARIFCQMADQDTCAEKDRKRHPVLWISNGKCPDWRKKKEVVQQRAQYGKIDGMREAPA